MGTSTTTVIIIITDYWRPFRGRQHYLQRGKASLLPSSTSSFCKTKSNPPSLINGICYFSTHYTSLIYSIYIYIAFKFSKVGLRLKCHLAAGHITDHIAPTLLTKPPPLLG